MNTSRERSFWLDTFFSFLSSHLVLFLENVASKTSFFDCFSTFRWTSSWHQFKWTSGSFFAVREHLQNHSSFFRSGKTSPTTRRRIDWLSETRSSYLQQIHQWNSLKSWASLEWLDGEWTTGRRKFYSVLGSLAFFNLFSPSQILERPCFDLFMWFECRFRCCHSLRSKGNCH